MSREIVPLDGDSDNPFDALKREDSQGEHWSARDLVGPLEYTWRGFTDAIKRGRAALRVNGQDPDQHISHWKTPSNGGFGRAAERSDYRLTREGAYAVIQGGDPNKLAVAAAWSYFRTRVREAEVASTAPRTYRDALVVALKLEDERQMLAARVAELAPKAAQMDEWVALDGWVPNREAAKMLYAGTKLGPNHLLASLEELDVLYRSSQGHLLPRQAWVDKGWVRSALVAGKGAAAQRMFHEIQYSARGMSEAYRALRLHGEPVSRPALGNEEAA